MAVFGPRRRVLVIPSATIERVAAKLESHGRIAARLSRPRPPAGRGRGRRRIGRHGDERRPSGPGAAAGVHQGDIIVAWNGEPIRQVQSLLRALGPDSVGQTVTLGLRRAGETKQVPLTIAERPAA